MGLDYAGFAGLIDRSCPINYSSISSIRYGSARW